MCERWIRSFESFWDDMGQCPTGLSLDRKNVNGHYSCGKCNECITKGWPLNCRWATQSEQANNTRRCRLITFNGKTQNVSQWARELGMDSGSLHNRIVYSKWSIERALTTPPFPRGQKKIDKVVVSDKVRADVVNIVPLIEYYI